MSSSLFSFSCFLVGHAYINNIFYEFIKGATIADYIIAFEPGKTLVGNVVHEKFVFNLGWLFNINIKMFYFLE